MKTKAAMAMLLMALMAGLIRSEDKPKDRAEVLKAAVADLVKMQEGEGEWPYEGVYRVGGELPIGYRVGGTAIVADTLLHAAPADKEAQTAIAKGLAFILKKLDDPLMAASTANGYDVRVWGHGYALEFFCHLRAAKATGDKAKAVDEAIAKLVKTLVTEEIDGGGWNYASRQKQASFVTAPIAQAMILAKTHGEAVPQEVLDRARIALEKSKTDEGAFVYAGSNGRVGNGDKPAGSAARSAICETTLVLLGGGSTDAVRSALEAFYTGWDELVKRHQMRGTHEGPFLIAPYYFYYGHRYAAQAIQMLPEKDRAAEQQRLEQVLFKTRDKDGSWNDRVFPRSRNYGTAMAVLILLGDGAPTLPRMPPARQE